jgi:hypothetical protein
MAKPTKAHPIRNTQPYLHHETLTQDQQAAYLGVKEETVKNLGHDTPVSRLTENPAGRMVDYADNDVSKGIVRGPARSQGVYGKFRDPQSGIAQQNNLDRWSDYAKSNSYHGGHGEGVEPKMRDQGRNSVPSPARSKDSDGYLADPKEWAKYEYGSDSGLGRLEKASK